MAHSGRPESLEVNELERGPPEMGGLFFSSQYGIKWTIFCRAPVCLAVRTDAPPMKGHPMCEDYPCCGHERGDCEGKLYGSDESIKADAYRFASLEDQGFYQDEY